MGSGFSPVPAAGCGKRVHATAFEVAERTNDDKQLPACELSAPLSVAAGLFEAGK